MQRPKSAAAGEQVVLEVGIAAHRPDVPQHLVEHARRASGAALAAQLRQQVPGLGAQDTDDDLPVGERSVVVGDLPKSLDHALSH